MKIHTGLTSEKTSLFAPILVMYRGGHISLNATSFQVAPMANQIPRVPHDRSDLVPWLLHHVSGPPYRAPPETPQDSGVEMRRALGQRGALAYLRHPAPRAAPHWTAYRDDCRLHEHRFSAVLPRSRTRCVELLSLYHSVL